MRKSAERPWTRHGAPAFVIAASLLVWAAAMGAMIVFPDDHGAVSRDVREPTERLVMHHDARSSQSVLIREQRPL